MLSAATAAGLSAMPPVPQPTPLQQALLRACHADIEALKPGNVALGAPAHRMSAEDFLRSAAVVAAPLTDARRALGERIEAAVQATMAAVACNTNLGIVLLLAPLVDAALRAAAAGEAPPAWRHHLATVLAATSVADGAAVARAILLAHPAGLGEAPEADVGDAAAAGAGFHHTLGEAMALAAGRDLIARQYASGFATVLAMAQTWSSLRAAGASREDAVSATFLRQLAASPDSHVARKHGAGTAAALSREVAELSRALPDPPHWSPAHARRLALLHDGLLTRRINPGTTADLTVASVFITELDGMQKF